VKPRPPTPAAGTEVVSRTRLPLPSSGHGCGSGPRVTVRAKSHDALMSATAKTVAALKIDNHSEPVLVVYERNAASVFFEQAAISPKAGLLR